MIFVALLLADPLTSSGKTCSPKLGSQSLKDRRSWRWANSAPWSFHIFPIRVMMCHDVSWCVMKSSNLIHPFRGIVGTWLYTRLRCRQQIHIRPERFHCGHWRKMTMWKRFLPGSQERFVGIRDELDELIWLVWSLWWFQPPSHSPWSLKHLKTPITETSQIASSR